MSNQLKKFERENRVLPALFNGYWNDDFFDNAWNGDFLPAANVKENKKEYQLDLSVPGFEKDDISIEIDKNVLKISAQKEMNSDTTGDDKVLRQEFGYSSFSRSFMIPENVDTNNIGAQQKDGILEITMPKLDKAPEDKIKKINVK